MTPYRVAWADDGIVVTTLPSTWWLRLRVHLQVWARRSPIYALLGGLVGMIVALIAKVVWEPHYHLTYAVFVVWVELVAIGAVLALAFVTACVRSAFRPAIEARFPRQITFRAKTIRVQPRDASPFETNWTWIQGATGNDDSLDILLSESPRTLLHIRRTQIGSDQFATLQGWLAQHGRLRG